ncbi:hypothetical protein NL676_010361 [Syzygium grande]|nr:hypothetical protein NL676_010361 [Syzygium grande]
MGRCGVDQLTSRRGEFSGRKYSLVKPETSMWSELSLFLRDYGTGEISGAVVRSDSSNGGLATTSAGVADVGKKRQPDRRWSGRHGNGFLSTWGRDDSRPQVWP